MDVVKIEVEKFRYIVSYKIFASGLKCAYLNLGSNNFTDNVFIRGHNFAGIIASVEVAIFPRLLRRHKKNSSSSTPWVYRACSDALFKAVSSGYNSK